MSWPSSLAGSRHRIALYSHDTQGLGHIRRTSLLARSIVDADPLAQVLLLTGAREATRLPLPERTEVVVLPGISKDPEAGYGPRVWDGSLAEVVAVRASIIEGAIAAFAPDVFIADKVPLGIGEELTPALRLMKARGETACVLGLRDVLDAPEAAKREWDERGTTAAVETYYDQVWVYGDAAVYDLTLEYDLPPRVVERTTFTGYLGRGRGTAARRGDVVGDVPYVLCMVGGGQDGQELAEAFAATPLPEGLHGVLVTGPYLPDAVAERIAALAAERPELTVHQFVRNPVALIEGARAVIAMGGYNTVCELLAASVPALVVPRTHPRAEQLVRAERLAGLGLLEVLTPDVTVSALQAWIEGIDEARADAALAPDLDGLAAIPHLVARLIADRSLPTGAFPTLTQLEDDHAHA